MRTVKIGEKEFKQIETAEDLSVARYALLKEFIIWKETGVNTPNLVQTLAKYVHGFDNNSPSQMLITLHDYLTGVNQVNEGTDYDQMIFCLITLEDDEDPNKTTDGFLKEKLDRFNALGLSQSVVEETVENFINGSSAHFVTYFRENLMSQMTELSQS